MPVQSSVDQFHCELRGENARSFPQQAGQQKPLQEPGTDTLGELANDVAMDGLPEHKTSAASLTLTHAGHA